MGFYEKVAEGYNELYGNEQLDKIKAIHKEVKIRGVLLDVGAGTCLGEKFFKRRVKKVISVDPSLKMLEKGKGVRMVAKAEKLPFKEGMFDSVISVTSLHHCDIDGALREINRVAKKNSVIALTFLKKSRKLKDFERSFKRLFKNYKKIEEDKDFIFIKK